jgi:hypothetical protein
MPSMSERDTVDNAEDRERIRNHVRTVLARLAKYLKEQKAKQNGPMHDQDLPSE